MNKTVMKETSKRGKYDSGWKKIIRQLFKDFMEFFFPEIHNAIDFSKKISFLDKELLEINPDSSLGDRVADVLVKVHLKKEKGSVEQYIRIIAHIEVQGKQLANFMERMFIYFYRTFDKEKRKKIQVISLAVLTDDDPGYRPTDYGYEFFGFKLLMQIPIVKLLDYMYNPELIEKMEASGNPMAMVVKAQLKSLELKGVDSQRKFEALKELIRQCYQKGHSQAYTRIILKFFALIIRLPEAYKKSIRQVIINVEEEFKMEYVPLWERDAEKRGKKKGLLETARNLLKMGMDIGKIADATGLKKEEIKKLSLTTH